eukprot:COSAG01_NODE_184_length_22692_cov_155.762758_15_plen_961_part_00
MALCDALCDRNWTKVQELLDGDAATTPAREKDRNGDLPLHLALAKEAAPEVTLKIFDQHPDAAREKDRNGNLPLTWALAKEAAPEVTLKIFAQHPDAAREKTTSGWLPLHRGAREKGNREGWLPLHLALIHKAAAELTLKIFDQHPAAAREKDCNGNLPLTWALAKEAAPEVTLKIFAQHPDAAREKTSSGWLPLHRALRNLAAPEVTLAAPEVTLKIFDRHPDAAREKDGRGELPLHQALVSKAAPELTLKIFDQHPDAAREKNRFGDLPLHLALEHKAAPEVTLKIFAQHPDAAREKNNNGIGGGNLPLHLALEHKAAPEVTSKIFDQHPDAAREKNNNGDLPLHLALRYETAPEVTPRIADAFAAAAAEVPGDQRRAYVARMPTMRADLLARCQDASDPASVCEQLRVGVRLVGSDATQAELGAEDEAELRACCALMRAALCSPDERLQISAALLLQALCSIHTETEVSRDRGKHNTLQYIKMVVQQPGLVRRLVDLLTVGAPKTRRLAAIVLGNATEVDRAAIVEQIKNPSVLQMLAVLSRSKQSDVQRQAEALLKLAGRADDIQALAGRGLDSMFAKPWPSPEFTLYHKVRQWRKPPRDLRNGDGQALVGRRIFAEGYGEGTVRTFHPSRVGASEHTVDFDLAGEVKVKLKRKKNKDLSWLVPPNESAKERQQRLGNHWTQTKGGKALTTRVFTRGASVYDVCAWLQDESDDAGVRCFYAGLIAELDLEVKGEQRRTKCHGDQFMLLTAAQLEREGISNVDGHLDEMMKAVAELQGFLGRYILDRGRSVHKSATCVLIYGEDREKEQQDGTLQRVAIKCMRNQKQFETEVRQRQGLDLTYVVGALRVHTPTDFADAMAVELHRNKELDSGADQQLMDERVRGYSFVIIMECAECDLGSDISHGHYAGRDKTRVQHLLRRVAMCFLSLEQRKLIHGDVKCVQTLALLFSSLILAEP